MDRRRRGPDRIHRGRYRPDVPPGELRAVLGRRGDHRCSGRGLRGHGPAGDGRPLTALAAAPVPPATRGRRMVAPVVTIATLSLATLALHYRDPHQHGSWGLCPFNAL